MCYVKLRAACADISALSIWLVLGSAPALAQDMTQGLFDKPVKTETAAAYDAPIQRKGTVTCLYYQHVVVKQVYFEGDESAAIFADAIEHGIEPPCDDPEASSPKAIDYFGGWLDGVKNDLVVTVDPDTFDWGVGFTIFRPLDHKILLSSVGLVGDKFRPLLRSIIENKFGVYVHYDRIFVGPCSVAGQGKACFEKVVKHTGVDKKEFTKCATMNGVTLADEPDLDVDPTVVAFGVQLFIPANAPPDSGISRPNVGKDVRPAVARHTTVGSLINCYPAE